MPTIERVKNSGLYLPRNSFENPVINGDFSIWQRGLSFTNATGFTADMWQVAKAGTTAVYDIRASADVPTNYPKGSHLAASLEIDVTTADASQGIGEYMLLQHNIEGYIFKTFAHRTFTVTFWIKSTKTGIYSIAFRRSDSAFSYVSEYTVNESNTWEYKTVVVAPPPTAAEWNYTTGKGIDIVFAFHGGLASITTSTFNTWQAGNLVLSSNQVNTFDNTANFVRITGVNITPGPYGSPFVGRDYQTELERCQRYYELIGINDSGGADGGTTFFLVGKFKKEKRASPTLSLSTTTVTILPIGNSGITTTSAALAAPSTDAYSYSVQIGGFTGLTVARVYWMRTQAIAASAEIS